MPDVEYGENVDYRGDRTRSCALDEYRGAQAQHLQLLQQHQSCHFAVLSDLQRSERLASEQCKRLQPLQVSIVDVTALIAPASPRDCADQRERSLWTSCLEFRCDWQVFLRHMVILFCKATLAPEILAELLSFMPQPPPSPGLLQRRLQRRPTGFRRFTTQETHSQ